MRKLLEPLKVGNMELRNRVILSAMAKYFCTNGYIGREYIEYYRNIAHGGAALIVPGIMIVDPKWYGQHEQPFLNDDKYIPGLAKAIQAVHAEGAKFACQLWMPGHLSYSQADLPERNGRKIAAVNYLSRDMLKMLQQEYTDAAIRCWKAGADAIEWHMAHTYLPEQFFSPYFNRRTDEYGAQNVENAMRFSTEILDKVKENCPGLGIIAKMNATDSHEGEADIKWVADAARLLEEHGVSLITVSGGGAIARLTGMSADGNWEEGWKVKYAAYIKKHVNIPVAACDSIRHPDFADSIISQGKCDAVALGRQLLAEPDYISKIAGGREDELKYCISCMHCLNKTPFGPDKPGCSVNPRARREYCIPKELNNNGDNLPVAVIGAGPAGLEAAVTLKKRGFKVTVFDKTDHIGGALSLAAVPAGRYKLGWMTDYYQRMLSKLDITVKLNTECTPETLKEMNPYAVFIATGSKESIPPVTGIDSEHVVRVRDYLSGKVQITSGKVAVLGAGLTGLETARQLALSGCEVDVVDMIPDEIPDNVDRRLNLEYARNAGVNFHLGYKISEITRTGVSITPVVGGAPEFLCCDTVLLALGVKPVNTLYDALKSQYEHVFVIGDSVRPRMIVNAISEAYEAAAALPAKGYVVTGSYFDDIRDEMMAQDIPQSAPYTPEMDAHIVI